MKNGEIVLNVSASATRRLTIDNDWIQFTARFNGVSQEVSVPMSAVAGIFAKETGYGFSFNGRAGCRGVARRRDEFPPGIRTEAREATERAVRARSHLQVVK